MNFPVARIPAAVVAVVVCALIAPPAQAKDHKVSIKDVSFSPKELKIKKGDTVTWTNADERDHTVTADDGSFTSGRLDPNGSFEHRFVRAGTFTYHCDFHPTMKGTVTVGAASDYGY